MEQAMTVGRGGLGPLLDAVAAFVAEPRQPATGSQRLRLVSDGLRLRSMVDAVVATLVGEAQRAQASEQECGVQIVSWLASTQALTRPQAHRLVADAERLANHPALAAASLAGDVSTAQVTAMVASLDRLPDEIDATDRDAAEQHLLGLAAQFDSHALARLSRHLIEVIAPDEADALEEARLAREDRQAHRDRHLTLTSDGQGSMLIRGQLPQACGALLARQLDAIAAQRHRTAVEERDPLAGTTTPGMRRADALIELAERAALHRDAPSHGGDRPHAVITMTLEQLRADAVGARLVDSDEGVSARQARQLLCDADLIPLVLGGPSGILDVGRTQRLVTPDLRHALHARDQGCVFPGCDRTPQASHAHHLIPWQDGGPTSLANLVLVCGHHHNLIEPDHTRPAHRQWQIRIAADGVPEVLPPSYHPQAGTPQRHQRFRPPS